MVRRKIFFEEDLVERETPKISIQKILKTWRYYPFLRIPPLLYGSSFLFFYGEKGLNVIFF
jgi:hypothetical protein